MELLVIIGVISAIMFVLSLLLLPWILNKIPVDYFSRARDPSSWKILLQPRAILRNIIGLTVVSAGIAMLVLPGQGLLTILIGLAVMQFPGKFELERWLVTRKGVLEGINWLRQRSGRLPLKVKTA